MRIIIVLLASVLVLGSCSTPQKENGVTQAPSPVVSESESVPGDEPTEYKDFRLEATIQQYALTPEMIAGIEVVREIKPEEWNTINPECMTELGFPPTPNGDWSVSEEQVQAYGLAEYSCLIMYPYAEVYRVKYGEAEHMRFYEYWRDTVLPCLKENGYETNKLPSFEVFTATAGTENEYHPIGDVDAEFSTTRWDEATEVCRVLPSADYALGLTDIP